MDIAMLQLTLLRPSKTNPVWMWAAPSIREGEVGGVNHISMLLET